MRSGGWRMMLRTPYAMILLEVTVLNKEQVLDEKTLFQRCDCMCDTIGSRLVNNAPADFGTWACNLARHKVLSKVIARPRHYNPSQHNTTVIAMPSTNVVIHYPTDSSCKHANPILSTLHPRTRNVAPAHSPTYPTPTPTPGGPATQCRIPTRKPCSIALIDNERVAPAMHFMFHR